MFRGRWLDPICGPGIPPEINLSQKCGAIEARKIPRGSPFLITNDKVESSFLALVQIVFHAESGNEAVVESPEVHSSPQASMFTLQCHSSSSGPSDLVAGPGCDGRLLLTPRTPNDDPSGQCDPGGRDNCNAWHDGAIAYTRRWSDGHPSCDNSSCDNSSCDNPTCDNPNGNPRACNAHRSPWCAYGDSCVGHSHTGPLNADPGTCHSDIRTWHPDPGASHPDR